MSDMPTVEEIETWSPDAKAKLYKQLQAMKRKPRRVFYCKSPGRACDGHPHQNYEYEHARADQWPPGVPGWLVWALVGGRGSGKTRAGSEYVRKRTQDVERIGLVGATIADVRATMIEGDSGLIKVCEQAGEKVTYYPSRRLLKFSNGAIGSIYTGEEPDRLRGPQHGLMWFDEPAHYPLIQDVWDMALLGLRLGNDPKIAITTTPLPTTWLRELLKDQKTKISRVSTYANLANLAPTFRETILSMYEGTRLGKQELYGELLEDVVGALWQIAMMAHSEVEPFDMDRIVVSVDPAGTANRRSDQTGIIGVGKIGRNLTAKAYVLEDKSDKYSPSGWAKAAMAMYDRLSADAIVVEKNYGGDMVESNLRNEGFTGRVLVKTAQRSKQLRAEPVVGLYEQHRVFHLPGLVDMEEEMLQWVPGKGDSPNRVDALVWAIDELIDTTPPGKIVRPGRGTTLPVRAGSTRTLTGARRSLIRR